MHLTLCSAFIMGFSPAPWMLFTLPERWDLLTVSWVADDSLHWILIRLPQLLLDFPAWSRHLFVAKTELTPSSAKTLLFLCSLSYPCPQTLTPNIKLALRTCWIFFHLTSDIISSFPYPHSGLISFTDCFCSFLPGHRLSLPPWNPFATQLL